MTTTSFRRAIVPAIAVLALGASLTACGGTTDKSTLNGAGASSQEKAQDAWRTSFQGKNKDTVVNYSAVGSGDGRKQFIAGGVDFAATDSYFKDDEGELTKAKTRCGDEDIIEVPAYISTIAIIFNVDGVKSLNMSADTLAKIFDNKITKWNDPAIAEDNKGVTLPDLKITPVHRSDDSGTTKNFTDYLAKASKSWSYDAADKFPVEGLTGEGTSGLVATVTEGKGTIGYADLSQAGDLGKVSVEVGTAYEAPSAEAAAKVVAISDPAADRAATDLAVDLNRTTTEAGTYPVVLVSYLVACQHYDKDKATLVKDYLTYVLSDEGQSAAAEHAGSAKLDATLAQKATDIVSKIAAK